MAFRARMSPKMSRLCIQAEMSRISLTSDGRLHLFWRQMTHAYRKLAVKPTYVHSSL
jgi:hypothetical protein